MAGVSVTLGGNGADTDTNGTFTFNEVRPGTYHAIPSSPGYVKPRRSGPPIVVTVGQKLGPYTVRLWRYSSISGTVVDEDGQPISYVRVTVIGGPQALVSQTGGPVSTGQIIASGLLAAMPAVTLGVTTTNALGTFTLAGLQSGTYHLQVEDLRTSLPYVPVAYPSPISLKPGAKVEGIQITFTRARAYRVRAAVSKPPGVISQVIAALVPRGTQYSVGTGISSGPINREGFFEAPIVPPGQYTVIAGVADGDRCYSGFTDVDVTNRNPEEFKVYLTTGTDLPGQVIVEQGSSTLDFTSLGLALHAAATKKKGCMGTDAETKPDKEGRFTFSGFMSDNPRLSVMDLPNGYYIKSGHRPIPGSPWKIVLAADTVTVSGTANVPGAQVVLMPKQPDQIGFSTTADATGRLTILNVPPGSYNAYSWEENESEPWPSEEFMRLFETKATSITVSPQSNPPLRLTAIE